MAKDLAGSTLFKDAVMKTPGVSGDNVAQSNGLSINGGQAGTSSKIPQVTTVKVGTVDKIAGSVSMTGIANR